MHQLFIDFKQAYDLFSREVQYEYTVIQFGVPIKLVGLIKRCLN